MSTLQYGITPAGFVAKPLAQIQAEIDAALQGILGKSAGTEPDGTIPLRSRAGQLKTLLTDSFSALWDLLSALNAQLDPTQAVNAGLAQVCSLTGTVQEAASASVVTETLTGVPGTLVPAGSLVSVPTTGSQFFATAPGAIVALSAWATGSYSVGQRVTNGGYVYQATAVTGADNGTGPTATAQGGTSVSGGVTWMCLGQGTGAVDVTFQASVVGPVGAAAGLLTTIVTPVYGWKGAYNVAAATPGALLETSAALRQRRELELHSEGGPPPDGIRTAVLNVIVGTQGVTSCTVFQNNTEFTSDGVTPVNVPAGMPPHSVMVLADYPGSTNNPPNAALDQAIAQAIWDAVGGGIPTTFAQVTGSEAMTSTVTDSSGNPQTVYWAKPTPVPIYLVVTVTYDSTLATFPAQSDAQAMIAGGTLLSGASVEGAIPVYGASFPTGKNVWASAIASAVFDGPTDVVAGAQPLAGVLDVQVLLGTSPNPTGSSAVPIDQLHRATFSSANITVNLTGALP